MKRMICFVTVMMICMSLVIPAFAAEDSFVPSIGYKDGPDIIDVEDFDIEHLVITSLKEAEEKTTDIYQEDRDLLQSVYEDLMDGDMELPREDEDAYYVIRDLVDVSFTTECRESDDGHQEKLAEEGVTITITFDLGVAADEDVVVMTYIDGKWEPIVSVENNGDGTVTCVFEDICPVVFCVRERTGGSETGDPAGQNLILWIVLMAASTCAIAVLVYNRRKHSR